jgi:alkylation response protein AidB-like acyl-CoA dehydrogenase
MAAVPTTRSRTQAERLDALARLLPLFRERQRLYDGPAEFPGANFQDLRGANLLALTIPEEYGGDGLWSGTKFADFYEILERAAAADSSTAQLLQVHSHASGMLAWHATPAQRDKYLPDIVRHGKLLASIGSEADVRSKGPEVYTAELAETSGGWVLNCQKHFASLAAAADYYLIWVAVPGPARYAQRQVFVLVPRGAPGVELINEWDTMGMRSTVSWAVKVTDYQVPADAVIGQPGGWATQDPRTFTLAYVANHLGTAQGAFDFTCQYVRERPYLAQSELVRVALGDMASNLYTVRSGLYAAARQWETAGAGGWCDGDVNKAELMSLQALHGAKHVALDVTTRAFDICGARATFRLFPLEQMYRDLRTFTLHFRDDMYMLRVADAILNAESFTAKGKYTGGSTPLDSAAGPATTQA